MLREHERTGARAAFAPIDGQDAAILTICRPGAATKSFAMMSRRLPLKPLSRAQ